MNHQKKKLIIISSTKLNDKSFNDSLNLESIIVIAKMNNKINYSVNYLFRFLINRNVPFYFKTCVLICINSPPIYK